jgi:hypothetical protein
VNAVAAAAGYVAFWAALIALPAEHPAAPSVATIAAHRPGASAWAGGAAHHVYEVVDRRARGLAPAQRTGVARAILEEAARATMDPLLVLAVIQVESAFDPQAVSGAGAVGLMQLLHPTMRQELERSRLGSADPLDPVANVRAGVRYLERLLGVFDDLELALMAYNAGPNRIRRHLRDGGIPERFLGYPRNVVRALRRHAAAADLLARGPASQRLCIAHAAPPSDFPSGIGGGAGAPSATPDAVRSASPAVVALAGAPVRSSRLPGRGGAPGARGDDARTEEGLSDDGLGQEWLGEDGHGAGAGPPSS